ncbi:MAG: electron transport complex subunit E [Bacteroidales bacterium]|nr:electron transport complex subunit E [Bacteroidales bacterium]
MNRWKFFTNGLFKENPTFVLLLGMCPTLGVTTSAINGLGMGLATTFVLLLSNITISSLKKLIPDTVRIPAFIVLIASFVTVVDLLMQAYLPDLHAKLGLFIPLIVVNCIVLGRAEAFASKHGLFDSALDGLGMGFGFTLSLTVLGMVREFLGALSFFDHILAYVDGALAFVQINTIDVSLHSVQSIGGALVFVLAPGAFLALGFLFAIINTIKKKKQA